MGRNLLKRAIRRGIQTTRNWLLEEDAPRPAAQSDFAYDQLNTTFRKLLKENPTWKPASVWGVLHGAYLAKALGIPRISAIEFGVAGGNGLVSIDEVACAIEDLLKVDVSVYGFDTGVGLPAPADYRDLPNLYRQAAFPMNQDKLRRRLKKAQLVLGLVKDTLPCFVASSPPPVAFVSFDLDYYSSTAQAFTLFDADIATLLPRVHCYLDDILGFTFSEFTGERLAVAEFNRTHDMRKISPIHGLRYFLAPPYDRQPWAEQIFLAHIFDHEMYGHYDGLVRKYEGGQFELWD